MESTGIGIDVRVELTHGGMDSINLLETLACLGPLKHVTGIESMGIR
jgi:hypothetical protein